MARGFLRYAFDQSRDRSAKTGEPSGQARWGHLSDLPGLPIEPIKILLGERCQFGSTQSGEARQRIEHRSIRAREVAIGFAVLRRIDQP